MMPKADRDPSAPRGLVAQTHGNGENHICSLTSAEALSANGFQMHSLGPGQITARSDSRPHWFGAS
jgi:hypothetical protein